jgi:hypothetical protein
MDHQQADIISPLVIWHQRMQPTGTNHTMEVAVVAVVAVVVVVEVDLRNHPHRR